MFTWLGYVHYALARAYFPVTLHLHSFAHSPQILNLLTTKVYPKHPKITCQTVAKTTYQFQQRSIGHSFRGYRPRSREQPSLKSHCQEQCRILTSLSKYFFLKTVCAEWVNIFPLTAEQTSRSFLHLLRFSVITVKAFWDQEIYSVSP